MIQAAVKANFLFQHLNEQQEQRVFDVMKRVAVKKGDVVIREGDPGDLFYVRAPCTLIGLVFMLGNMADPKSIGPAMAIALLTTLYGALLANLMFQPMLTKLEGFTEYEVVYRDMVLSGLRSIARGESPRNIQDQMVANLPAKAQEKMLEAA